MEIIEQSFAEMLAERAADHGDKTAIVFDKITYTYAQLWGAVELCAEDLIKLGVQPGDHVGLWSVNSPNWLISFFAIIRVGGVAVLFNYGMSTEQVSQLLKFTDVKYIACGINKETLQDPMNAVKAAMGAGLSPDKLYNMADNSMIYLKRLADGEKSVPHAAERDVRRTSMMIFTSGTTGMPKAVELSQYGILNNARGAEEYLIGRTGGRLLLGLPLFHSYGLEIALGYLLIGAELYVTAQLLPDVFVKIVQKYQITDIFSVNVLFYGMLAQPDFESIASYPKLCGVGGSFTPPAKMMALNMAFINAAFLCGYGQTETGTMISMTMPEMDLERRNTSVGKPLEELEVKILDEKEGFLPQGRTGEIVVRGYTVMNGYYKGTPEQQKIIDEDGWLHTGDLGYFDEDGILFLAGRVKDIIIKKGENIAPAEIEARLIECDGILDAKVLGAPHPLFGENVEACILLRPSVTFDEEKLRAQLKGKLSSFKTPEHFFVYPSFPMGGTGKVDSKKLQIDMLGKLKVLRIREALEGGITAAEITLKNTVYNIVPAASMAEEFAEAFGFDRKHTMCIRLAVEEMLLERIENAYEDVGDITMKIVLREEYLSILFEDHGKLFKCEEKADSSYSAAIILKITDNFHIEYTKQDIPVYCMDFRYDRDFDVNAFLQKHTRA